MISYEPYYNPVLPSNVIKDGFLSKFVNMILRKNNVSWMLIIFLNVLIFDLIIIETYNKNEFITFMYYAGMFI